MSGLNTPTAGAHLDGASLFRTHLEGVNLREAHGDGGTRLPDGSPPPGALAAGGPFDPFAPSLMTAGHLAHKLANEMTAGDAG